MRAGPEIQRGWGGWRGGALDFLAFFASFWGNAKKKEPMKGNHNCLEKDIILSILHLTG
jgi:hypothetical protein